MPSLIEICQILFAVAEKEMKSCNIFKPSDDEIDRH